jgi:MFS family permease
MWLTMPLVRVLIAIGAGLALADASVVTLALPPMLVDLDTTVEGVAAVIGVYTLVLAAALPAAAWLRGRISDRTLGVTGFALFAVAGALCATPEAIGAMLAFRVAQAVGAAAALVAAFALLRGDRLWVAAAVFGTAVGPALGGALTQAFDWRAIFIAQVPLALAAAAACLAPRAEGAVAADGGVVAAADPRRAAKQGVGAADEGTAAGGLQRAPTGGAGAAVEGTAMAGGRRRAPTGGGLWAAVGEAPDAGGRPAGTPPMAAGRTGAVVALAALSAALTGVLFLLVLLLVSGWSVEPLAAAAAVTVLPIAAFAGARIRGDAAVRASAGCALVGAGVLALAVLPGSTVAWILAPQVLAGLGMGMALPALAGELLPERTPRQAASLLSIRHAGITIALIALAPVAASQLDTAVADLRERGAALILDARLPPLDKIEMAGPLVGDLDPVDPRDGLRRALDRQAGRFADDPDERREYAELTERADETLLDGIDRSFRIPFLIAGGLALIGAVAVLPRAPAGRIVVAAVALGGLALPAVHAIVRPQVAPERVAIADPCEPRALPDTGGIGGFVQDQALAALDRAACRFGSSREALALALADEDEARAYEAQYGVDPRSAGGLLDVLGINLG